MILGYELGMDWAYFTPVPFFEVTGLPVPRPTMVPGLTPVSRLHEALGPRAHPSSSRTWVLGLPSIKDHRSGGPISGGIGQAV